MTAPSFPPVPDDSPIEEDGACDPDRSWAWRDEPADVPGVDDEYGPGVDPADGPL